MDRVAGVALLVRHALAGYGDTDITNYLNGEISQGSNGVYTGGRGIFVRNPFDDLEHGDRQVVPATFWSNDMFAPSALYPGSGGGQGNPWCPNDGTDGLYPTGSNCDAAIDPNTGENNPWNYAQMAYVVASGLSSVYPDWDIVQSDDWGWGVFYATDSNSVDKRCRWLGSDNKYDCPGGFIWGGTDDLDWNSDARGTGFYPAGNPYAEAAYLSGGGTGCHFDGGGRNRIDQADAYDWYGNNLVQDPDCQCNYALRGDDNDWMAWVYNWIQNYQEKDGFSHVLGNSGTKIPSWILDISACWVNNPRDLIKLNNAIYWARDDWSNQKIPGSYWSNDPGSLRLYWGWSEIPIDIARMTNPKNWDTVMIKLPAAICGNDGGDDSADCLSDGAQTQLGIDLQSWQSAGYLMPGFDNIGKRPGSYIVFVKEFADQYFNWQRYFYCQDWSHWSSSIKIAYDQNQNACYADWGSTVQV